MNLNFLRPAFKALVLLGAVTINSSLFAQLTIDGLSNNTGQVGALFTATIQTSGEVPAGYSATGLPPNLKRTGATISGYPTTPGVFQITLGAFNANGQAAPLNQSIIINDFGGNPPVLEITSGTSYTAETGSAFSYQIEATPSPISYNAFGIGFGTDLPNLSVNMASGLVSGTVPSTVGSYDFLVLATYADGTTVSQLVELSVETAPAPEINFVSPTTDIIVSANETFDVEVDVDTPAGYITQVELLVDGVVVDALTSAPYVFSDVSFGSVGEFDITARATNSVGSTTTTDQVITVFVQLANPLVSNTDFVKQTYVDLFNRAATTDELEDGLAYLQAGNSRGQYVVELFNNTIDQRDYSDTLEIYRTMAGEWPSYNQLQTEVTTFRNTFIAGAYAGTLAFEFQLKHPAVILPITSQDPTNPDALVNNAEWANEIRFINGLYQNKYGFTASELDLAFTINALALGFYNSSLDGETVEHFATNNNLSGLYAPSGYPLSIALPNTGDPLTNPSDAVYGYEIATTRFPTRVKVAQSIAGLLRRQPTDQEVVEMSRPGKQLANTIQDLLNSPEYAQRFITAFTLTVNTNGNGDVVVNPAQLADESVSNVFVYNQNQSVSLTAVPDAGHIFIGWTGSLVSNSNPLSVTMNQDLNLTAVFEVLLAANAVVDYMAEFGVVDPDQNGEADNADGDSATNLEEYVFGTNPANPSSQPQFETGLIEDQLVLQFVRLDPALTPIDLQIIVECNAGLDPDGWMVVPESQISSEGVNQDGVPAGYVKVRALVPLDECLFLRVRIVSE